MSEQVNEKVELTEEQKAAIAFSHEKPAIVTASAGSGKTTLLVERIIRLISDVNNPINASSLAIVTFTVNATQSIREKLNKALQKRIAELSDKKTPEAAAERDYLSEQIINIRSATISTINAFCLGIIRENIQQFDLPINFTIADDTKKTSMKLAAQQRTKQDFYDESESSGFIGDEIDWSVFSKDERDTLFYSFDFEDDVELFKEVENAANMLASFGNIDEWLNDAVKTYSSPKTLEQKYMGVYIDYFSKYLRTMDEALSKLAAKLNDYKSEKAGETDKRKIESAKTAIASLDAYMAVETNRFSVFKQDLETLIKTPTMDSLQTLVDNAQKNATNSVEISRCDNKNATRKEITVYRNKFKDAFAKVNKIDFSKSEEELTLGQQQVAVRAFAKLVKKYISYYSEIKNEQGCIDFSDCELKLLKKLQDDDNFRNQLSQRFSCIIVDEFQDTNDVQAKIFKMLGRNNLFYVGDVKQSIYAFRGGNPTIMAKLCKGVDGFTPLPLNMNFRSRKQVVDVVNAAFCGLMTEEYGGVDYEPDHKLEYGDIYPPLSADEEKKYNAEYYALSVKDKTGSDDKDMSCARFTARLIKNYMDDKSFFITKKGERVHPSYSDFIILTRKGKSIKLYREALAELNIPAISAKSKNFLLSDEISLIMSLLKIIDNPLCDEETLNVLMSPLYDFSEDEIAELKLGVLGYKADDLTDDEVAVISKKTKNAPLYKCLNFCTTKFGERFSAADDTVLKDAEAVEKALSDKGIQREFSKKAETFLSDLNRFRYYMSNSSTDNLIARIYEETDILAIVSAYDDSRQRISNLRSFETMSTDFVSREYGTLNDFIRFIDKSIEDNLEMEEAATPEDAANSVRIMTFHASKGLEAPICILAELQGKPNDKDWKGSFIINHDYYYSMDYVDRKNRFYEKTFSSTALKLVNKRKPIGEELRLLYVAMTRAREKLIMIEKNSENVIAKAKSDGFNPDEIFDGALPFRWVLSSLLRKCTVEESTEGDGDDKKTVRTFSFNDLPLEISVLDETQYKEFLSSNKAAPTNTNSVNIAAADVENEADEAEDKKAKELAELIIKPYHNTEETHRQAKFSVTELAHKNEVSPFKLTKPAFARSSKMTGADIGNAYHHCMEHISFDVARNNHLLDNIHSELCRLCDEGKLTEDEVKCIKVERIAGFFLSDLGQRMLKSPRIEREFPFYAEIDVGEVDEKLCGTVGVQGRIDAFFVENNEIVVVDYKTDYDLKAEQDAYEKQVRVYARVLPMLLGMKVSQTYLYSFSEGLEHLI